MSRTVLLCGSDAVFMRMLTYELHRAGFSVAGEGIPADCVLFDLDTVSPTALPPDLPAIGYTRMPRELPTGTPCLRRPFAVTALLDALSRLAPPGEGAHATTVSAGLRLDDATRTVRHGGTALTLMPGEYALLRTLFAAEGEPVSRADLLAALPSGGEASSNLTEVLICALRRHLEESFGIRPIRTVRGVGYRYVNNP